ncbi:MAG: hypothetical protein LBB23_02165 [Rickettsiales bacterium]|nr:hypothetical protein [Rickettsiales bacterium]
MEEGSNHPVRLRFATARHPATLEGAGKLFAEIPRSSRGMTYDHYPVRLRFATARHPFTLEGAGKLFGILQFEIPAFAGMTAPKVPFLLPLPRPAAPSTPSPAKGTIEPVEGN